jgi:hypothetical protein
LEKGTQRLFFVIGLDRGFHVIHTMDLLDAVPVSLLKLFHLGRGRKTAKTISHVVVDVVYLDPHCVHTVQATAIF